MSDANTRWSGPHVNKVPGAAGASVQYAPAALCDAAVRPLNLSC